MKHEDNECVQDERIRSLTTRVDKLEEQMYSIKDAIKDLKEMQSKMVFMMLSAMGLAIINLITFIVTNLMK